MKTLTSEMLFCLSRMGLEGMNFGLLKQTVRETLLVSQLANVERNATHNIFPIVQLGTICNQLPKYDHLPLNLS